jgi:hypothetical protein
MMLYQLLTKLFLICSQALKDREEQAGELHRQLILACVCTDAIAQRRSTNGTNRSPVTLPRPTETTAMRTFLGMIIGALVLTLGVYVYDSMQTSSVANGQTAQDHQTIVNWDVAANDWNALKQRTHEDWIRLSQK